MPDKPTPPPDGPRGRWGAPRKRRPTSETLLLLYLSFQITRARAAQRAGGASPGSALEQRCKQLIDGLADARFAQDRRWVDAYEVERELLVLQSGPTLLQSLRMLLDRADATRVPGATNLRRSFEGLLGSTKNPDPPPVPADALMLPLALTVLEGVQWNQASRFEAAPLKRDVVHRLAGSGFVAFGLFVLPYLWADVAGFSQSHLHMHDWSWLPLWTALTAGLLGAFFSRLLTIQKVFAQLTINDIQRIGDWNSILLRGGVGMIGALALLLFLQSGIVDGGLLFPHFDKMRFGTSDGTFPLALPSRDLALLVVWCFIAGFSERIVPRILAKTESQLTAAATADGSTPGATK